jgi:hypothetical protein
MQPEKEDEKDPRQKERVDLGGVLAPKCFPANELGRERVKNVKDDQNIEGDREDILVKLLGQSRVHEALGDPQTGNNKKQYDDGEDPTAIAVDCGKPFPHKRYPP